jgi:predicted ester cyclase
VTQNNRDIVERYFTRISGKTKTDELIDEYVDDVALREHIRLFEAAFPSYELRPEDIVAEDDRVAVRATFRGVHRGEFNGIRPTGKEVTVPVMLIYRLQNGRIVEHWMNADVLSLLQQLGAAPVPA